ncbi:hypothetical protein HHI36_009974 [Cryptolaemus montrouzieri]|uniref:ATP synthase F0 subunit 8 n=1 Tax=Cryptolaemus montrouzieri TaxID=559131 RepID=A0ABD2MHC6_9CUCU
MEEESIFSKVINNSYFYYLILTILKLFLIYVFYKLGKHLYRKYCKKNSQISKRINSESNLDECKMRICPTFNICNRQVSTKTTDAELKEIESEETEGIPLRRSFRIAKLKS